MVELLYGGDTPLVSRYLDELWRPRLLQRSASHHALLPGEGVLDIGSKLEFSYNRIC